MYDPIPLLETTTHIRNLIKTRVLMIESGLMTENVDQLAGMDKSLNFLDKEVDKAKVWVENIINIYEKMKKDDFAAPQLFKIHFSKVVGDPATKVLEKLKDLPKAIHNIAQLDLGKEAVAGVKGNWAPGDAARSIGDFFGKDSSIGKSMGQLEALAVELGKLTNIMKVTISSIARSLKFAKGKIDLKDSTDSLIEVLQSFDKGKTLKAMKKILKKNADQGLKGKFKAFLQDVNPLADTEPLFGVDPNDVIASWLNITPKEFMQLGPLLLKPLNKGPADLVVALANVQDSAEEVEDENKSEDDSQTSPDAPDPVDITIPEEPTPEDVANVEEEIEEVIEDITSPETETNLKYPDIKEVYTRAKSIIDSSQKSNDDGDYWPSYVKSIQDEIGEEKFNDKLSTDTIEKWNLYQTELLAMIDKLIEAEKPDGDADSIKTALEQAIEKVKTTAADLKTSWEASPVVVESREKKKGILLERWLRLAGLE
jgi:hypothetical protein